MRRGMGLQSPWQSLGERVCTRAEGLLIGVSIGSGPWIQSAAANSISAARPAKQTEGT